MPGEQTLTCRNCTHVPRPSLCRSCRDLARARVLRTRTSPTPGVKAVKVTRRRVIALGWLP